MNAQTSEAIILKRIEYGEADRIVTVLTPLKGKLTLIAKSSRRQKSKLAGGLELFSISDITYIEGRSELRTLTSARLKEHFGNLTARLDALEVAYKMLQRAHVNTDESCEKSYFELLVSGLRALDSGDVDCEIVNVWFCVHLLMLRGTMLQLNGQSDGSEFSEKSSYEFSFDTMGFLARDGAVFQPSHIKLLRLIEKVSSPLHLLSVAKAMTLARQLQPLLDEAVDRGHKG